MEKIVLIGCGGHAKSALDVVKEINKYEIVGFVDSDNSKQLLDCKYIGNDEDLNAIFSSGVGNAFICMGNNVIRARLYRKLKNIGFCLPNIISKSAAIAESCVLGDACFVGKNSVINTCANVGCCSIINTGAIIEHDCRVGNFAHISPGAVLCGSVAIGNFSHIGSNATVIQNITITDNVIVGAGSVVIKNILKACTAFGNPCREKEHNNDE